MEDILKQVSDIVTDQPITITVDVKDRSYLDKLLSRNKVRVFQVKQIVLGNLIRISKLLRGIDEKDFKSINKDNILDSNYNLMGSYGHALAEIVAIAIHNKKGPPPGSLTRFIEANFTSRELINILSVVLKQMDVTSFMISITSIRGLSILENQDANATPVNGKEVSL